MKEKASKIKAKAKNAKAKVKSKIEERMPDHILFKIVFMIMGFGFLLVTNILSS